jgi:hypothetical protein
MLCGMPVDRRVTGRGWRWSPRTTADASLGVQGRKGSTQVGSGRGGAAGVCTGVQVACQQAEGLDVVPGASASAASASGTALMVATRGSP